MMKRGMMCLAILLMLYGVSYADSAEVLPKGVFSIGATYYHYFNIHKRYNPDGDSEDIDIDYNRDMTSAVFPELKPLDPLVPGGADIGHTDVNFHLIYRWFEFCLNYGITDNLTVGILVPYNYSKNYIEEARLDNSHANVGKNPFYRMGILPPLLDTAPIIPLTFGGIRLDTEDIQDLLGKGVDVNGDGVIDIQGYGFKRFETWSKSGIGDIELLGKYRFFKNDNWRLAFATGVRLPTGKIDDPDILQDIPFGDNNTDILFRLYTDYIGIKRLLLNATIRYDLQLPDKELRRVSDDVNNPITRNKEEVDRDLGDILELEAMANYSFTKELSGGLTYIFTRKFKDRVDGNKGLAYESLELETDLTGHMIIATLGYSTVPLYLEKKFPIPFSVNLAYRYRFAGLNNATRSQYVSLNLVTYFK
jgi:hypothetical protein